MEVETCQDYAEYSVIYPNLPRSVTGLHQPVEAPERIDTNGFFRKVEAEVRFGNSMDPKAHLRLTAGTSASRVSPSMSPVILTPRER
jgi:hypothetical protein